MTSRLLAGIECGGTTFKIATAIHSSGEALKRLDTKVVDTTTPQETIRTVVQWLNEQQQKHNDTFKAIGIASFGPVDLDKSSDTYGFITTTPKPGWANCDLVGAIKKAFPGVPIGFETDVNAPALAEVGSNAHG